MQILTYLVVSYIGKGKSVSPKFLAYHYLSCWIAINDHKGRYSPFSDKAIYQYIYIYSHIYIYTPYIIYHIFYQVHYEIMYYIHPGVGRIWKLQKSAFLSTAGYVWWVSNDLLISPMSMVELIPGPCVVHSQMLRTSTGELMGTVIQAT